LPIIFKDHPNSSKVGKHSLYADKLNPTVLVFYLLIQFSWYRLLIMVGGVGGDFSQTIDSLDF